MPPILKYSSEIDPEQDVNRREAVSKYNGNDVVKATEFLNIDNASTRSPPASEAVITEVQDDSSTTQRLASPTSAQTNALLPISEADTSSPGTATISLLCLSETHSFPRATETTPLLAISQAPSAIDDQDQSSAWDVMCECPCM